MVKTNLNSVTDSRNRSTGREQSEFGKSFFSKKKTAFMLGVTMTTLWSWNKKGILCSVKIGRKHYYRLEDIKAYFRKKGGAN